MSYEEMRDYFAYLLKNTGLFSVSIDWGVIRPEQITSCTAGKRKGLQVADAVASSFYYAVEKTPYGYTEDRYARMLKPVVYHRDSYQGYGLKFWPGQAMHVLATEKRFLWVREEYE